MAAKKKPNKRTRKSSKPRHTKEALSMAAAMGGYKEGYKVDKKNLTAGGSPSISTGDAVARALVGLGVDELKKVAAENSFADRFAGWEKNLNPGQLRMNLGNVLRGMKRHDQKVTVNGKAL